MSFDCRADAAEELDVETMAEALRLLLAGMPRDADLVLSGLPEIELRRLARAAEDLSWHAKRATEGRS